MDGKRLAELHTKLDKSGICGTPVITDEELHELETGLKFLCDYFDAANESTIFMGLHSSRQVVRSVLATRRLI